MASSSNYSNTATTMAPAAAHGSDSATTFVQADPSTFRHIVQKLTGATDDPSSPKLPVTHPARAVTSASAAATTPSAVAGANIGTKRPAFKLHERRQTAKKLEIKLNNNISNNTNINSSSSNNAYSNGYELCSFYKQRGGGTGAFLVSPVSTLEFLAPRVSPRSPREELLCARGGGGVEEEERAIIAEKGFYLHPSPLSTPRGGAEPELLPLFPLTSPRNNDPHNSSN